MLDSGIFPAIGHIQLQKVNRNHIVQFYNNLMENGVRLDGKQGGLSEKTILHHHRLLSKIFNNALQWDLISTNPIVKVKPPKVKKKEAAAYDDEQTIVLLQAL
jgi:site-specific recombinase XerC